MTHADIDRSLFRVVQRCVEKIDAVPALLIETMAPSVERISDPVVRDEWRELLQLPWVRLRTRLPGRSERAD